MEAQHHSPARPSVDEDHRWKLLACIFRKKELAVNGEAVFTLEDHLLWRDQLLAGEILRQRVGGQHLAAVLRDFVWHERGGGARTQAENAGAVGRNHRRNLDGFTVGDRLWRRATRNRNPPDMAPVDIVLVRRGDDPFPVAAEGDVLYIEFARRE